MRHFSTPSPSFVDPSSLSLPSPPSEASSSPQSPLPSLVTSSSTSSSVGPPRKRSRTETTPEEKREARAHRNRIAAQNSRDKRKAQFSQLEDKVRTLQQENDQLRAQLQQERQRRDGAEKDRENAELKERVKSLEEGWEAVLKALQSQGLPSSSLPNGPKNDEPSQLPSSAVDNQTSPQSPSTTFPVFINSPLLPPLSPLSTSATGGDRRFYSGVPAAGGSAQRPSISALGLLSSNTAAYSAQEFSETSTDEDGRIDALFREVLSSTDCPAISDAITDTTSSATGLSPVSTGSKQKATPSDLISCNFTSGSTGADGNDMEMDRLLDLLPDIGDEFQGFLDSVMEDEKVSEAKAQEDWDWEITQPSVVIV